MKKFFTNIPLQKEKQLQPFLYQACGNRRLVMDEKTRFPIIPAINGYVEAGEEFRVIAVMQDSDDAKRNLGLLEEELKSLCEKKRLPFPANGIECIAGSEDQTVISNLVTVQSLLDCIGDEDELYVCVTFGTKPMAMTLLSAVRNACLLSHNTKVSCIVYGEIDRRNSSDPKDWKCSIYDETPLVELDRLSYAMALKSPHTALKNIKKMQTAIDDLAKK